MPTTHVRFLLACSLVIAIGGCGTMLNVQDTDRLNLTPCPIGETRPGDRPAYPFGGVGNDLAWITGANQPIDVIGAVVDMPFSLVGDVVTLPWIAHERLRVVRPNANEEWKNFWLNTTNEQEDTHLKSPAPIR